jgi:hypothetical protein
MMEETTRRSFLKGIGTVLGVLGLGAGATQVVAKPQPVAEVPGVNQALVAKAGAFLREKHYRNIVEVRYGWYTILRTEDPNTWVQSQIQIHDDGKVWVGVSSSKNPRQQKGSYATADNFKEVYRSICSHAFHNFV